MCASGIGSRVNDNEAGEARRIKLIMAQVEKEARFINRVAYAEIPGTALIELRDEFLYYSAVIGRTIIVPDGFVCDGESFILKSSTEAGVLHDYLYRKDSSPVVSRKIADAVLYEASRVDKCTWVMSWAKWAFVRVVSHCFYHKLNVKDSPKG
jgi:hypothetical protein